MCVPFPLQQLYNLGFLREKGYPVPEWIESSDAKSRHFKSALDKVYKSEWTHSKHFPCILVIINKTCVFLAKAIDYWYWLSTHYCDYTMFIFILCNDTVSLLCFLIQRRGFSFWSWSWSSSSSSPSSSLGLVSCIVCIVSLE